MRDGLHVDFCSFEAAKHSVVRWHYSRAMPAGKLVRLGVWESKRFVGVILFGTGANRHLASPFGLKMTEACELVRVALAPGREHPTSKALSLSLRMLHRQSPDLKVIVSYADTKEGHLGVIYQATNWIFLGASSQSYLKVCGKVEHPRSLYDRYGRNGQSVPWLRKHIDPRAERVPMPDKLKYAYAFAAPMRKKLQAIAEPYPKSDSRGRSDTGDTSGAQPEEGGSTPTRPLHLPSL